MADFADIAPDLERQWMERQQARAVVRQHTAAQRYEPQ
jgi:hypothetical protein